MLKNKFLFISIALIAMIVCIGSAAASDPLPPRLPCNYYGSVYVDGVPAPVGTTIIALITGFGSGETTVTVAGEYDALMVQNNFGVDEYPAIAFYINGVQAVQTSVFYSGGAIKLDLSTPHVKEPCTYSGNVIVNGLPAPVGTKVLATITGLGVGETTVTTPGEYTLVASNMYVPNGNPDVAFYINDVKATQTSIWTSGESVTLDLSTAPAKSPCIYSGSIVIDGVPAPVGTKVLAVITGLWAGETTVTTAGEYVLTTLNTFESGDASEVSFYINDVKAVQTSVWKEGIAVKLDLSTALPKSPCVYSGSLSINDSPAPVGTVVLATIDGIGVGQVSTTTYGEYSLVVDNAFWFTDNAEVSFYINGVQVVQTSVWKELGAIKLDLSTTMFTPEPEPTPVIPGNNSDPTTKVVGKIINPTPTPEPEIVKFVTVTPPSALVWNLDMTNPNDNEITVGVVNVVSNCDYILRVQGSTGGYMIGENGPAMTFPTLQQPVLVFDGSKFSPIENSDETSLEIHTGKSGNENIPFKLRQILVPEDADKVNPTIVFTYITDIL